MRKALAELKLWGLQREFELTVMEAQVWETVWGCEGVRVWKQCGGVRVWQVGVRLLCVPHPSAGPHSVGV
jgi:hypothetical protein